MLLSSALKKVLLSAGVRLVRFPHGDSSAIPVQYFLKDLDLVIDAGAATGEFAMECRALGFKGEIHSFEPVSSSFKALEKKSRKDANWSVFERALGRCEQQATIFTTSNSGHSSSFLSLAPAHIAAAPGTGIIGNQTVEITTLDRHMSRFVSAGLDFRIGLKLDVQGYELEVLRGAGASLSKVESIIVELSLEELYIGAPLFTVVIEFLSASGFELTNLRPGFRAPDGKLMQFDGVFTRKR